MGEQFFATNLIQMMNNYNITNLVEAPNLSVAWAHAFLRVANSPRNHCESLVVAFPTNQQNTEFETKEIRDLIDQALASGGLPSCETIAGTIFPKSLWNPMKERQQLFERYNNCWPRIKKCRNNSKGTYFRRMTAFNSGSTMQTVNQLQQILNAWEKGLRRNSAFQLPIFDPRVDHTKARYQGFPCLQQVAITPKGSPRGSNGLGITGFYPTQYLFKKAYGNYLGLYRLGEFLAHEMKIPLATITCIVTDGQIGQLPSGPKFLASFKKEIFEDYQIEANKTDKNPGHDDKGILIPLLGLAGETGELLSEYKKYFRDGNTNKLFKERLKEELGDLLWYLNNCASKAGLSLDEIAVRNLRKCRARWLEKDGNLMGLVFVNNFDSGCPENERIPRRMEVELREEKVDGKARIKTIVDGVQCGDELTDNSYFNDGYRFHDIFHFAYAAVLGWSPVIRAILKRKRKSHAETDEVDDGARAIVTEEGISAIVFAYASQINFLDGIENVDYEIIRLIRMVTSGLEVSRCNEGDWEDAIMQGFTVWRKIEDNGGGKLVADLDERRIWAID